MRRVLKDSLDSCNTSIASLLRLASVKSDFEPCLFFCILNFGKQEKIIKQNAVKSDIQVKMRRITMNEQLIMSGLRGPDEEEEEERRNSFI